jgi:hypothetical protein
VKLLSPLFEVPAQLALVLTLAASGPGGGTPTAPLPETAAIPSSQSLDPQPLEGPYRFSESNWLRALREDLPAGEGQPDYSGRIFKTSGGRYYVPAAAERRQILDARANPALAGRAAQAFAADNAARMRAGLHRPATGGELYIAHVFGPEAAISFIMLAETRPSELAANLAPGLAQSAPELVKTDGAPLTLAQLYMRLTEPMRKYARSGSAIAARQTRADQQAAALDLKPTIPDVAQPQTASASPHADSFAWHAEVSESGGAVLSQ